LCCRARQYVHPSSYDVIAEQRYVVTGYVTFPG
jgi:hypothetical protein